MGDFYFINPFRLKRYFPFIDHLTETLIYDSEIIDQWTLAIQQYALLHMRFSQYNCIKIKLYLSLSGKQKAFHA